MAGRLSIQVAAHWLQKENGGSGVLLGGVPGTPPANVAIIGGGTVGINAAKMALGMGANVTILDLSLDRLRYLDDVLDGRLTVLASNDVNVEKAVVEADAVIGALLIPAPRPRRSSPARLSPGCARGRWWSTWPSTRAAAWREQCPPPTPTRSSNGRGDPILRGQHARLRGSDLDLRPDQRHLPLRLQTGRTWVTRRRSRPIPALAKGLNVVQGKLVSKAVAEGVGMDYTDYEI